MSFRVARPTCISLSLSLSPLFFSLASSATTVQRFYRRDEEGERREEVGVSTHESEGQLAHTSGDGLLISRRQRKENQICSSKPLYIILHALEHSQKCTAQANLTRKSIDRGRSDLGARLISLRLRRTERLHLEIFRRPHSARCPAPHRVGKRPPPLILVYACKTCHGS